ncbi:hypothetical protein ACTWP4_06560 [Gracilibacillus sp. D59]|uniref:hypothetical protein n=1 Tax=Gracilibacillus sp. D59 TaxID=3457434 RepID=UPI003FCE1E8B
MNFYEKLPNDLLIAFYYEIIKTIENGIITKSTYYEYGLIISVMNRKGIPMDQNGRDAVSA